MGLKYLYVPSGVKAGTAYGVMPNSADADFDDFARNSAGSRVDKNGFINTGLGLGSEWFDSSNINDRDNATNTTNSDATITTELNTSNIGWSISATSILNQDKIYKVEWKIISTNSNSGTFFYWNGVEQGGFGDLTQEGSGVYYLKGNASGTNADIRFNNAQPNSTITWSLSVREVTDANTDVPRLDYTGGGCPSLLLEDESTNITQYSEDFTQSYWTKEGNPTIESDVEISPTGSLSGSYLKAPVGTNISPRVTQVFGCAASQTYTGSVFVKKDSVDYIRLLSTGATASTLNAYYNVSNGTLGASGSPDKAKIEDYGNGWYRLSLVINTTQNTGGATFRVQLAKGDGVATSTYDGTEKNIIFGAQLENQAYATSYIPNYGTAAGVTRIADAGGSTGDLSSVINSQEGTFFFEGSFSSTTGRITLNSSTTTWSDRITILAISNNALKVLYEAGDVGADASFTVPNIKTNGKLAIRWIGTTIIGYYNGTQVFYKTNNGEFSAGILDRISLAGANGTSNKFAGSVKQLRVYDEYLSDAEMTELTTL